jgi:hypothetical protein
MTLPASGQISFADINVELKRSSTAEITLENATAGVYGFIQNCATPYPDPTNPDAISEWYGYNHNLTASLQNSVVLNSTVSCTDACEQSGCGISSTSLYKYLANGKYYFNVAQCYTNQGLPQYTAVCSGGSPLGQNCYTFNADRTLASTQTCTTSTTTTTTTELCQCLSFVCTGPCVNSGCACPSGDVSECNSGPCQ